MCCCVFLGIWFVHFIPSDPLFFPHPSSLTSQAPSSPPPILPRLVKVHVPRASPSASSETESLHFSYSFNLIKTSPYLLPSVWPISLPTNWTANLLVSPLWGLRWTYRTGCCCLHGAVCPPCSVPAAPGSVRTAWRARFGHHRCWRGRNRDVCSVRRAVSHFTPGWPVVPRGCTETCHPGHPRSRDPLPPGQSCGSAGRADRAQASAFLSHRWLPHKLLSTRFSSISCPSPGNHYPVTHCLHEQMGRRGHSYICLFPLSWFITL